MVVTSIEIKIVPLQKGDLVLQKKTLICLISRFCFLGGKAYRLKNIHIHA